MTFEHNLLCERMVHTVAVAAKNLKKIFIENLNTGIISGFQEKASSTPLLDFVTEVDIIIEEQIRQDLYESYPKIMFTGEETGKSFYPGSTDTNYFLLDPIDGTKNFLSLRDYFSISLAYIENEEIKLSVIAHPMSDLIVYAHSKRGAFCLYLDNKIKPRQIYAAKVSKLNEVQLDCEMTFTKQTELNILSRIVPYTLGMRKAGSTALDLMMMALGRRSILIANHLKPYDLAAGLLIARESCLTVTDFIGNPAVIHSKEIIAAHQKIHAMVLHHIKQKNDG